MGDLAGVPYWCVPPGGGSSGSGDVVGPGSGTDNAIARWDTTTGKLLQDSAVTVSDVSGASVTIATTAGNALALAATAPTATTGASQVGKAASLAASAAVASTDTNGAAAGGAVTITGGAAARRSSGNAAGGAVTLTGGAGIGTGATGLVSLNGTTFSANGVSLINGGTGTRVAFPAIGGGSVDTPVLDVVTSADAARFFLFGFDPSAYGKVASAEFRISSSGAWSASSSGSPTGSPDVAISRLAAAEYGVGTGAAGASDGTLTAATLNGGNLRATANTLSSTNANGDIALTPNGIGLVKFGTLTGLGIEVLSGFITIKDAGGTSRKIAVIS